jgi:hypothetical protein
MIQDLKVIKKKYVISTLRGKGAIKIDEKLEKYLKIVVVNIFRSFTPPDTTPNHPPTQDNSTKGTEMHVNIMASWGSSITTLIDPLLPVLCSD